MVNKADCPLLMKGIPLLEGFIHDDEKLELVDKANGLY